jgi:uncharacterized protein (TIGR02996 family)
MDHEAFLRAIAERPDDQGPRLVYADWLDEQADPRAEWLRVEAELWTRPPGDPRRQELGRRGRELRAGLDAAWLRRVEGGRLFSPGCHAATRGVRGGVADFYEWMRQCHWEWVSLAVLAPIDQVCRALVECRAGTDPDDYADQGRWRRNVRVRGLQDDDLTAGLVPVVQLKGHPWTVAFYEVFNLTMRSYRSAQADARALSDRLATLAVEFSSEDTASATGYLFFECGLPIEWNEWSGFRDSFASRKRTPPWTAFPQDYPEEVFAECGLYVPAIYSARDPGGPCVALGVGSPESVARADLIDLWPHFSESPGALREGEEFPEVHILHDEMADYEAEQDGEPPPDAGDDIPF